MEQQWQQPAAWDSSLAAKRRPDRRSVASPATGSDPLPHSLPALKGARQDVLPAQRGVEAAPVRHVAAHAPVGRHRPLPLLLKHHALLRPAEGLAGGKGRTREGRRRMGERMGWEPAETSLESHVTGCRPQQAGSGCLTATDGSWPPAPTFSSTLSGSFSLWVKSVRHTALDSTIHRLCRAQGAPRRSALAGMRWQGSCWQWLRACPPPSAHRLPAALYPLPAFLPPHASTAPASPHAHLCLIHLKQRPLHVVHAARLPGRHVLVLWRTQQSPSSAAQRPPATMRRQGPAGSCPSASQGSAAPSLPGCP